MTGPAPPMVVDEIEERALRCARCGHRIEICAFCQEAGCTSVICQRCLRQELGQSLVQPHIHGG